MRRHAASGGHQPRPRWHDIFSLWPWAGELPLPLEPRAGQFRTMASRVRGRARRAVWRAGPVIAFSLRGDCGGFNRRRAPQLTPRRPRSSPHSSSPPPLLPLPPPLLMPTPAPTLRGGERGLGQCCDSPDHAFKSVADASLRRTSHPKPHPLPTAEPCLPAFPPQAPAARDQACYAGPARPEQVAGECCVLAPLPRA